MNKADPNRNAPEEVDRYLAELPARMRETLAELRGMLHTLVPHATERVSYGIPILRLKGDCLGFSATRDHCSLHLLSPQLAARLGQRFPDLRFSGATIHFTPELPLCPEILQEIIAARLQELAED